MLKYNICFVKREDEILLLNREYPSWMGCWNGIGGKLEEYESPRASMIREIEEETGIAEYQLEFKGMITWTSDGASFGGMYTYVAHTNNLAYPTPIKTREGILDWKHTDWVLDSRNQGIAANIPFTLPYLLNDDRCYEHHCAYVAGKLQKCTSLPIDSALEVDSLAREQYFARRLRQAEVSSK